MIKTLALFMLLLIVALSGCIGEKKEQVINTTVNATPAQATVTPVFTVPEPSTVYIEIRGSKFTPSELIVTNGTTVRWTNMDSAQHTVRVDNISSQPLNKRDTWNYTFNRNGTFEYNCSLYPVTMKGRITVK